MLSLIKAAFPPKGAPTTLQKIHSIHFCNARCTHHMLVGMRVGDSIQNRAIWPRATISRVQQSAVCLKMSTTTMTTIPFTNTLRHFTMTSALPMRIHEFAKSLKAFTEPVEGLDCTFYPLFAWTSEQVCPRWRWSSGFYARVWQNKLLLRSSLAPCSPGSVVFLVAMRHTSTTRRFNVEHIGSTRYNECSFHAASVLPPDADAQKLGLGGVKRGMMNEFMLSKCLVEKNWFQVCSQSVYVRTTTNCIPAACPHHPLHFCVVRRLWFP